MRQQLRQQEEAVHALKDELATSQQEQQQSAEVSLLHIKLLFGKWYADFWYPISHQAKPGSTFGCSQSAADLAVWSWLAPPFCTSVMHRQACKAICMS